METKTQIAHEEKRGRGRPRKQGNLIKSKEGWNEYMTEYWRQHPDKAIANRNRQFLKNVDFEINEVYKSHHAKYLGEIIQLKKIVQKMDPDTIRAFIQIEKLI